MSVTNPDRVVTKQDLADFYSQIKPYLGSYPIAIANKFSKGDLYSTNERIIGQWIDGKPLYQKTINFGTLPNASTVSIAHNISNIDKCVKMFGYATNDGVAFYEMPLAITSNNITYMSVNKTKVNITSNANVSSYSAFITIQYTKTTDSATAIGDETDYSTTEKVVGTWIDGKPVYQKTIQIPISAFSAATPDAAGYCVPSVAHNISNIDVVVDLRGVSAGNVYRPLPNCYGQNTPDFSYFSGLGMSDTLIFLECGASFRQSVITKNTYGAYVIVQYTKTTD